MIVRWFDPERRDLVLGVVIGLVIAMAWHVVVGG